MQQAPADGRRAPDQPADQGAEGSAFAAVYLRRNLPGRTREHWYHVAGCRQWLVVERDTRSHAIFSVRFASAEPGSGGGRQEG